MSKTVLKNQRIKKPNKVKHVIGVITIVIIIAIVVVFLTPRQIPNKDLVDDDPFFGPVDAKVVIVEFSDFECPACGKAETALKQIRQEFKDKIKLVFRDFPLTSIHPHAFRAAEAANCAMSQEKYWEMHDKLYENQTMLDLNSLKFFAKEIGLNEAEFNECMNSRKYLNEILADIEDAKALGVNATPTFFINGEKFVGALTVEQLRQIINAKLAFS